MCEQCLINARKHFPHFSDEELSRLLLGATSFLCGDVSQVEKDLVRLKKNTDGTLDNALAFADQEVSDWEKKHGSKN